MGDISVWIPVVVAVVMALPGVWAARQQARRDQEAMQQMDADTTGRWQQIADRSAERIQALEARMEEQATQLAALRGELAAARAQEEEWRKGIERLVAQLVSHGYEPVWQPQRKAQ